MKAWFAAAALTAFFVVPAVAQTPPAPHAPVWETQADGDDLSRAYPGDALVKGMSGAARLRCVFNDEGRLDPCTVASEEPAGAGFGDAALTAAKRFKAAPMAQDGRPIAGTRIALPMQFVAPNLPVPQVRLDYPSNFARLPTVDEVRPYYPEALLKNGSGGAASASCRVSPTGSLTDCRVLSQSPKDAGLGEAALAMTRFFQITAVRGIDGMRVLLPFEFPPTRPPPGGQSAASPFLKDVEWVERPGGEDMVHVYPQAALDTELSGKASIACIVNAQGTLDNCQVAEELPGKFGFGEAALKLAPLFQMKPEPRNGQPVVGAAVLIPVFFRLTHD